MTTSSNSNGNGYKEGFSRCLSQTIVYPIERFKVRSQTSAMTVSKFKQNTTLDLSTSSLTAGLVFFVYFSIYNKFEEGHPAAGPVSAFVTSLLKIPIGNCMRLIQAGSASNIIHASRKLKGRLYNGYGLSLVEDIIELDLRNRIYQHGKKTDYLKIRTIPFSGVVYGTISGSVVATLTTPFDTVKSVMVCTKSTSPIKTAIDIVKKKGPLSLYNGFQFRFLSNIVKSTAFFMLFEIISL
jgi:hypothetical protein